MAQRTIEMQWSKGDTIHSVAACRNDAKAANIVEHTLAPGGRYLVSPVGGLEAYKQRGRVCEFLKGRRYGRTEKAKVRFLDDGVIGHVDPGDLLPCPENGEANRVSISTPFGDRHFIIETPMLETGYAVAIYMETNCVGDAFGKTHVVCDEREHLFDHSTPGAKPEIIRTPCRFENVEMARAEAEAYIRVHELGDK